ncbi:MAG: oligosaccharide flippase family protein [Kiritimatiellae bacterium]|nr:oligosaccharide flippase family protein [Kiritimatiellia bacterium]
MKLDFVKHAKRNLVAVALNRVLLLFLPFVNRTLFLWLMGPEYLGLNGLFTSVLGMLSLAELGFGAAIVCSMYKPVAEDDKPLLCAYLAFYRTIYRWVGGTIFVVGLSLLPFVPHLIHGNVPPDIDLRVLYLIHLANTTVSYFLFAYRGAILYAHFRGDVVTNFRSVTTIAQYLVVFAILLTTQNYYHYLMAMVIFTLMNNLLTVWQARRLFPDIHPEGRLDDARRKAVLSDAKSIFLHKLGAFINFSVDNLVISAVLGLKAVAVYGNYYYIATKAGLFASLLGSTLNDGFGNRIHTESKESNFRLFMKTNRLAMVGVVGFGAVLAAVFQPFIAWWSRGDPSMMRHALTPALMLLYFFVSQSRQTLLAFKSGAGLWKQDRWKSIVGGAVNLSLNFAFIFCLPDEYKLDGVILSTIVAFLFVQIPWETRVVFREFFGPEEGRAYVTAQTEFALLAALLSFLAWGVTRALPWDGVWGLAAKGTVAVAIVGGTLGAMYSGDLAAAVRHFLGRHHPPREEPESK